ncbi:hypothetical protein OIU77_004628 [Salix suchowensis]|uniref:Uncharacterized protein n=1 Tax=Salix suchowensis TaxID=1278906 RepID=A0ABQ9AX31_9ROSI|nr:hypothetical protein OIU77_004628 [Salix suchowensis]
MSQYTYPLVNRSMLRGLILEAPPKKKQRSGLQAQQGNHPQEQQVEDVIEKEGHRVIVVETYEENGHHNTKVSISPEQPHPQQNQRHDGGVKFKSPSLVEKAKEKMEEEADYVHPNVGKGVYHGSGTEKRYPSEILV